MIMAVPNRYRETIENGVDRKGLEDDTPCNNHFPLDIDHARGLLIINHHCIRDPDQVLRRRVE